MKANAIEGKRESIETEYVLHILGLGVCADTLVCCFALFFSQSFRRQKWQSKGESLRAWQECPSEIYEDSKNAMYCQ